MFWARAGGALLGARDALLGVIHPARGCDATVRLAFEREAHESNARVLHGLAYALPPLCVAAIVLVGRVQETDPARIAWRFWVIAITATLGCLAIPTGAIARRGASSPAWRALGDGWGCIGLIGAAAMSANAQRVHPNINVFVISLFAAAFFLRMTPGAYAVVVACGTSLVAAAIEHFQPNDVARHTDELSLISVALLSSVASFLAGTMHFRIFLARRQVEELNGELERRVEAQVGEIVRRAREVEELNTQLNEKVLERSRELSTALARLAGGADAIARGAVLGGRAEIESWIGSGGMGVVYRGRDRATNKTVAVKVVQAGSASELDGLYRFLREAQAMASVTHPAIVRSIHVDVSEDGRLFQMMELVDGESLDARLARAGPLPAAVAARLGAVLADALATAHAAGIVHRDVKPSNVMLTSSPPGLKLLDFGISVVSDEAGAGGRSERLVGTPEFVSPEQVGAPLTVGAPADLYSLGLVLYLSIAGRLPFAADTAREWFITHLVEDPVELSALVPDVDPALARAVMECLSKDPERRPTAKELAVALASVANAAGVPELEALGLAQPSVPPPESSSRTTVSRAAPAISDLFPANDGARATDRRGDTSEPTTSDTGSDP